MPTHPQHKHLRRTAPDPARRRGQPLDHSTLSPHPRCRHCRGPRWHPVPADPSHRPQTFMCPSLKCTARVPRECSRSIASLLTGVSAEMDGTHTLRTGGALPHHKSWPLHGWTTQTSATVKKASRTWRLLPVHHRGQPLRRCRSRAGQRRRPRRGLPGLRAAAVRARQHRPRAAPCVEDAPTRRRVQRQTSKMSSWHITRSLWG